MKYKSRAYHSALKPEIQVNGSLQFHEAKQGITFTHDLMRGFNEYFTRGDCIYCEPSWRAGFDKYMKRANIKTLAKYSDYLLAMKDIINKLKIPTYMIIGKHMIETLDPEVLVPIKQHNYDAYLAIWYAEEPEETLKNHYDACAWVAKKYNCIVNFCCGYGGTVEEAIKHKKKFVCSDINPKCIYYVATNYLEYKK